MDPIKAIVTQLMLDIDDYLSYIEDYGKPNAKYFNFVLNKQGIMLIFLHKSRLIIKNLILDFMEKVLISLKYKFISLQSSHLKQAALIFLLGKIYFTDDVAIGLKLRINGEEWSSFKSFLDDIKRDPQYQDICLMLYHLFTENFFKFTVKTKKLALDFGTPDDAVEEIIDPTKSRSFWNEVQDDILKMQYIDVEELKQLATIRDEALKPFEELLPEKASIDETLEVFESLKDAVAKLSVANPKNTSRKEIIQKCKEYMNQTNQEESSNNHQLTADNDNDSESITTEMTKISRKKKKKKKMKKSQKIVPPEEENDEGTGESENEYKLMTRRVGYTTQNIMQGIGGFGSCSSKLKKCYE